MMDTKIKQRLMGILILVLVLLIILPLLFRGSKKTVQASPVTNPSSSPPMKIITELSHDNFQPTYDSNHVVLEKSIDATPPMPPAKPIHVLKNKLPVVSQEESTFTVQAASFENKQNAENLRVKIRAINLKPKIAKIVNPSNGRILYKVTIGDNLTKKEADHIIKTLQEHFNLKAMAIKNYKSQTKTRGH